MHSGRAPLIIRNLPSNFSNSTFRLRNIPDPTDQTSFVCKNCSKIFSFERNLTRHVKNFGNTCSPTENQIDDENPEYKCDICNTTFTQLKGFKRHKNRGSCTNVKYMTNKENLTTNTNDDAVSNDTGIDLLHNESGLESVETDSDFCTSSLVDSLPNYDFNNFNDIQSVPDHHDTQGIGQVDEQVHQVGVCNPGDSHTTSSQVDASIQTEAFISLPFEILIKSSVIYAS